MPTVTRSWVAVVIVIVSGTWLSGCSTAQNDGQSNGPNTNTKPLPEVCNNGLDDNGDGRVDEGCGCTPGMKEQCFVGDPKRAGIGECTWGSQMCIGQGEIGLWGPCTDYGTATTCSRGNGDQTLGSGGNGDSADSHTGSGANGDRSGSGMTGDGRGDSQSGAAGGDGSQGNAGASSQGGRGGDGSPGNAGASSQGGRGGDGSQGNAGGTGDRNGATGDSTDGATGKNSDNKNCHCVPGAKRICDSPIRCAWGLQQCLPDGRWGECVETPNNPVAQSPNVEAWCKTTLFFQGTCCMMAGLCCQPDPKDSTELANWGTFDFVGNCNNVIVCSP